MIKIKIIDNPYTKQSLSIEETKKTTDFLDVDSEFESVISNLRQRYGILTKQFLKSNNELAPNRNNLYLDLKLVKDCIDFCHTFQLPKSWWESILFFIKYNLFITPEKEKSIQISKIKNLIEDKIIKSQGFSSKSFSSSLKKSLPISRNHKEQFYLIINEKMSQRQFISKVKSMWSEILEEMKKIPKPKKHKMIRYELAEEIVKMRDGMNLPFPKISDKLCEKYFEKDSIVYDLVTDTKYIMGLYKRWKEKFSPKS